VKGRIGLLAALLLLPAALSPNGAGALAPNPCEGSRAPQFLCPNLRIGAPSDIYVEHGGC
jgi:hypothetical protein